MSPVLLTLAEEPTPLASATMPLAPFMPVASMLPRLATSMSLPSTLVTALMPVAKPLTAVAPMSPRLSIPMPPAPLS